MSTKRLDRIGKVTLEYCKWLPKVELHAHLHGSIRPSTFLELVNESCLPSNLKKEYGELIHSSERNLNVGFRLFDAIHDVVNSLDIVRRITFEMVHDFAKENCKYLEIRTTPRSIGGSTINEYVETILSCLDEIEKRDLEITTRLIFSIDRSKGAGEEAIEMVRIIAKYAKSSKYVVGIDFSGNPNKSNFKDFREAFDLSRELGLKVSIHCAEIEGLDEETRTILNFRPDRLGHAIVLSNSLQESLLMHPIPIEICPTSNIIVLGLKSYDDHPTAHTWWKKGYPFTICTDDYGIFSTSLSLEFFRIMSSMKMTQKEAFEFSRETISYIFEDDNMKNLLGKMFDKYVE